MCSDTWEGEEGGEGEEGTEQEEQGVGVEGVGEGMVGDIAEAVAEEEGEGGGGDSIVTG